MKLLATLVCFVFSVKKENLVWKILSLLNMQKYIVSFLRW